MQNIILSFTLLLAFFSTTFGQISEINNVQTPAHTVFVGTNTAMIKPDDTFKESKGMVGFTNQALDAAISIREGFAGFDSTLSLLGKDLFKKEGLLLERELVMNGYKARLYKHKVLPNSFFTEKKDSMVYWSLLYGNERFSFFIIGVYPLANENLLSEKYEKSLLSFVLLEEVKANPIERLNFTLDINDSPLQFGSIIMETGAMYVPNSKNEANPNLIIFCLPFATEKEEQKQMAVRKVKPVTKENIKITSIKSIEINGLKGYEVIGYEKDGKINMLIYSVMLFDDENTYTLRATALKKHDDNLAVFRKVVKTFKIKDKNK